MIQFVSISHSLTEYYSLHTKPYFNFNVHIFLLNTFDVLTMNRFSWFKQFEYMHFTDYLSKIK